jgi:hypothetical protein
MTVESNLPQAAMSGPRKGGHVTEVAEMPLLGLDQVVSEQRWQVLLYLVKLAAMRGGLAMICLHFTCIHLGDTL